MATRSIGGIHFDIEANTKSLAEAYKEVNKLEGKLKQFYKNTKSASDASGFKKSSEEMVKSNKKVGDSFNGANKKSKSFFGTLGQTFGKGGVYATAGIVVAKVGYEIAMMADKYQVLQQRIKTATKDTNDFHLVNSQLLDITRTIGNEFQTNVEVFQGLARVAPELNATNSQILTLTETVNQLGVIGGTSSEAMKNGLLQFTQGLGAGVFRAEEFNSILENMPEVANRIAKGMGMSVGELRKMVIDGKLLSTDVFDSLLKQAPQINKEFEDIPMSIGRAGKVIKLEFANALSQINNTVDGTQSIAEAMIWVSKQIKNSVKWIGKTIDFFKLYFKYLNLVINTYKTFFLSLRVGFENVKAYLIGFIENVKKLFDILPDYIKKPFDLAGKAVKSTVNFIGDGVKKVVKGVVGAVKGIDPALKKHMKNMIENGKKIDEQTFKTKGQEQAVRALNKARIEEAKLLSDIWSGGKELVTGGGKAEEIQKERIHHENLQVVRNEADEERIATRKAYDDFVAIMDAEKIENAKIEAQKELAIKRMSLKELFTAEKDAHGNMIKHRGVFAMDTINMQVKSTSNLLSKVLEGNKKQFAIMKAFNIATTTMDGIKATAFSFTQGAKWGGPIGGGIMAAITAGLYAGYVAKIAASKAPEGRARGGAISGGVPYEVGEQGTEMATIGGKNFLLPGADGNVTSAKDLQMNKSKVPNVIINNNTSVNLADASASVSDTGDIIINLEEALASRVASGQSSLGAVLESTFSLNPAGGV